MPAPGQIISEINPEAPPAHQEFAQVMRHLCQLIIDSKHGANSQKAICDALEARRNIAAVSQPTLTSQLSARRRPDLHLAKELHALAAEAAEADPDAAPVPVTLAELEDLHARALVKHCVCCPDGAVPTAPAAAAPPAAAAAAGPVDLPALATRPVAPVPPADGDRQHDADAAPAWPPRKDLERHLRAGRAEDARVILRHAGTTPRPADVADAVAACRAADLDAEADTILHHAGRREPGDVLRVAKLLIAQRRHADADVLFRAVSLG